MVWPGFPKQSQNGDPNMSTLCVMKFKSMTPYDIKCVLSVIFAKDLTESGFSKIT